MNKQELIDFIAADAEISKASAKRALDSFQERVIASITKGNDVALIGFGSFKQGKRAARTGRNPATGAALKIAASKTVKFSAGKAFKDAVNKRKK